MKNHNAIRCVDEYQCSKCGKAWDINDLDIPDCVEPVMIWRDKPRVVEYFGLSVGVPSGIYHLAVDSDGTLCGFYAKPLPGRSHFDAFDNFSYIILGHVNLNGINWKETLREI